MVDVVQTLATPSLLVLLFVVLVGAGEIGRRLGRRGRDGARGEQAGTFATASLVLLALLIAIDLSAATVRREMHRAAIVDEANALRDVARLAPLLPDDDGPAIVNDLRRMLGLALGLGSADDPRRFDAVVAETGTVSARMWDHLAVAVAAQPGSLPAARLSEAVTVLDDAVERRTALVRDPMSPPVDGFLAGTALAAMALLGCRAGAMGTHRFGSALIGALLLSCLVVATIETQRQGRIGAGAPLAPLQDVRIVLPPLP